LAKTFSETVLDKHYSDTFQTYEQQAERQQIKFNSNNKENYNLIFAMDELLDAIGKSHDSAVGPDDIHYQMVKHLPSGGTPYIAKHFKQHMDKWQFSCKLAASKCCPFAS